MLADFHTFSRFFAIPLVLALIRGALGRGGDAPLERMQRLPTTREGRFEVAAWTALGLAASVAVTWGVHAAAAPLGRGPAWSQNLNESLLLGTSWEATGSVLSSLAAVPFLEGIRRLLVAAAGLPDCFPTGSEVAPAFILDARRLGGEQQPPPGSFDNRWVVFPSDLPSSKQLRDAGIEQVVVVQRGTACAPDLAAGLRAYQASRLPLILRDVTRGTLSPLRIPEMAWLFDVIGRLFRRLSVKRGANGGYGRWVPLPPSPSHG